ncbi:GPP34 family phosphoprotein [Rhodococcoides navarretei]|uniref:GPP34 family phosphoprotein n=1 Tax=Rhodococcus navarretei TaxID=3128981 RepID=A0ABU9CRK5_9NOCA
MTLIAVDLVIEQKDTVWGLFPTTASPHSAASISLISAVDLTHKVIVDADKKLLKQRAKQIAEGEWAGAAVRKAVSDVNAAVRAAVMVPVIVSTTSS